MRFTPASLLSVLTTGPDDRWLPGDGAFRIVHNPRLGVPMAPFAVFESAQEPRWLEPGWRLNGPGAFGDSDIDGEAWLVLGVPGHDFIDPGYVMLDMRFDEPPNVAVVRAIGDTGVGIMAHSTDPYRLAAPSISVIRIRGRCHIDKVQIASGLDDFPNDRAHPLGLPVPDSWPQYHGVDDPLGDATTRVRAGAQPTPGPHEEDYGNVPADREERRVAELVEPWLMPTLESLVSRSLDERFHPTRFDEVVGSPQATRAEVDDLTSILVAATDPGVARWLGLADNLQRLSGSTTLLTVAGVWAVPAHHELLPLVRLINDPSAIQGRLSDVLNERVVLDLEELGQEVQLLWGWTQAWIDFDVQSDRPPPPRMSAGRTTIWTAGETPDDDRVSTHVDATGLAPLGLLGVRVGDNTPLVHTPLESVTGLLRPLLVHEGTAFGTSFRDPFDTQHFVVYQSDAFGRWSDDGTPFDLPSPTRPGLPSPEPVITRTADLPSGDQQWVPRFDVHVPIPARTAGQPQVDEVTVTGAGPTVAINADVSEVSYEVDGPAIEAGGQAIAEVLVTFHGDPQSTSESRRSMPIVDPRPPKPPIPPAVLRFTTRADGSGTAAAAVPLLPGPNIAGYHVEVAHETDLVKASHTEPPAGSTRDERAQFWLQQPLASLTSAFYRLSPKTVPISAGTFTHLLPGDLDAVVAYRLVPVGRNGASADPATCPLVFYAVPRGIVPPPPLLTIDRSVVPAELVVESRPGGVTIIEHRIRMLDAVAADPRTGRVVASGPMTGDTARVPVPAQRPFSSVVFVAEVRGRDEPGQPPLPGRWSKPSNEQIHLAVPAGPPGFVIGAHADGLTIVLDLSQDAPAPAQLSGYVALLYTRATGAAMLWQGPLPLTTTRLDVDRMPEAELLVVVVDPLGRRGTAVTVDVAPGVAQLVRVPDVVGWFVASARGAIEAAGFRAWVGPVDENTAVVASVSPEPGEPTPLGSWVSIVPVEEAPVARTAATVEVPDVVGDLLNDACARLEGLGLIPLVVETPSLPGVPDVVGSLDPPPSTPVSVGREVIVVPRPATRARLARWRRRRITG